MTSVTEPILTMRWLNSILVTDSVLSNPSTGVRGGFHLVPPLGVKSPFGIVRQETAAADLTALDGGGLIWVPQIFQVNLYERERGDYTRLDPLAARIYSLLHAQIAENAEGIIFECYRQSVYAFYDNVGEVIERFINQKFTIEARAK